MKIAISGLGITGSSCAYLLAAAGHEVFVFEQAEECSAKGAGILISPSGQTVLGKIGILDEVIAESAKLIGMQAQQVSGRSLVELRYSDLASNYFGLGVHRGRLFMRLLEKCRNARVKIRNNFQVSKIEREGSQLRLVSNDEEKSDYFDILIVADGFNSKLRSYIDSKVKTVDYSHAALWTTAPCSFQPEKLMQYVQSTKHLIGLLPIGQGESSFFWGLKADEYPLLLQQKFSKWREQVLKLCPNASSIFDTLVSFEQLSFGRYRHVGMSKWYGDGIILLGDAAHSSSPHLGQGANLGLEDAYCFASALNDSKDFTQAAQSFTSQRQAKLRYYQQLTRMLSPFFQSDSVILGIGRDIALPCFPHLPFVGKRMLKTFCGEQNSWLSFK